MAATIEGRRLTEAHRLAQVALSKGTVADFLAAWRLLDPTALDATFPAYARVAKLIIQANRNKSTALAQAYLEAFRKAEGVTAPLTAARAAELAEAQAMTSLMVTGPVTIREGLGRGLQAEAAVRRAMVASAGAVTRHALNGGRETIEATVERDSRAEGLARVTDGKPCYFCAMLAGRGAVYKDDFKSSNAKFTGSGVAKCHDHCGCSLEPVYNRDAYELPTASKRFADIYADHSHGSGAEKLRNFRRAYEALS